MRRAMHVRIPIIVFCLMGTPALAQIGPRDVDKLPSTKPALTAAYGTDPLENGDLRMPEGKGPFPVVVLIHGGCWTKGFATKQNLAPLASALQARGIATWNIEYRQIGDPGAGWPGTFQDWGNGVDYLKVLAKKYPLDMKRVVVAGHSAGGHAALWVAARGKLPKDSSLFAADPLKVKVAVDIDGPGALAPFVGVDAEICGKPVIEPLMGGSAKDHADRYAQGTPRDLLPLHVPQYLVASVVLTPDAANDYVAKAKAAGDSAQVITLTNTGHFEMIAPGHPEEKQIEDLIVGLMK